MPVYGAPVWKKAPFIRLLLSLTGGIILQWQIQAGVRTWSYIMVICLTLHLAFFYIPFFTRYRFAWVNGIITCILFLSLGAFLTWQKDIRHNQRWLGYSYKEGNALVVSLTESPVEKPKSLKVNARLNYLIQNETPIPVSGTIILYFKKERPVYQDSSGAGQNGSLQNLRYGSQLIFKQPLQQINNSGNPGGFDYKQFSLFRGITHQCYLKPGEFEISGERKIPWFDKFLFSARENVLNILRRNIKDKKTLGLAEALLIGYKDDLDKTLVQSYTNTGVVHIIAISGLHLGLIYWLLVQVFKPLQKKNKGRWLRPVLIISGLWLFSLLAGAQPSVLRSALMFSCIVVAEGLTKRSQVFNTLAFSAFILLCINPFWLWDAGFQLSYAAVLSIIIFMRPIYNLFYIKNKLLDFTWKLNAVTIAAQLLTVPLSIYHFHQFPNYFLLTNLVAVPLSGIIILCEIFLCTIAWIPFLALPAGKLVAWMIGFMNGWVKKIESLPFPVWNGLQISILQAILLFTVITGAGYWLMGKNKQGLFTSLTALLVFFTLRTCSFLGASYQEKIIIYNVPSQKAIDLIIGRNCYFMGDSELLKDDIARSFHLRPSRTLFRVTAAGSAKNLVNNEHYICYNNKKILLLDESMSYQQPTSKEIIDLLVISKKPVLHMVKLATIFTIRRVVFDSSVPSWKISYWKKDCDSLHIPYHDVTAKGAFVMNLR